MTEHESLGTALPAAMKRVRDILIPRYQEIGPAGGFAIALMHNELDRATQALAEGDVVAMIKSYQALNEFKD